MLDVEKAWSHAIATNDVRGMDEHTADDWVIVGTNGAVSTKAGFIAAVTSGDLVHDGLTVDPDTVRVYGDTGIVSGIARSSGTYKGQRFSTHERSTDLFVRQDGRWRCVFTQLTAIAAK
jgi:ketosteroid isomerase-like protein